MTFTKHPTEHLIKLFKKALFPRNLLSIFLLFSIGIPPTSVNAFQIPENADISHLAPISESWIKEHLRKDGPKIVLTTDQLKEIKIAIKESPAISAYYDYLYKSAVSILKLPALERKLEGRRLLTVSRNAVSRISTLSIVFAISNERRFLKRLNEEILTVCDFSDWNPTHFLDVGEMAYGVAIGLDWSLDKLPSSTIRLAKKALVEKALKPSLEKEYSTWVKRTTNWNQVCHGGLSVAAVAVADKWPRLSAQIINRAIINMPLALKQYSPDGIYPEGASYWAYGTSYTLLALSTFQSAFGTDFNLSQTPGFMESALFVKMLTGHTGLYYNYFDSRTENEWELEEFELFAWFSDKNKNYFDGPRLINKAKNANFNGKEVSRLSGAALCWMLNAEKLKESQPFPENWKGDGTNPIIVFKSKESDPSKFYLAAKGGRANLSHGNMDAGSFIFELYGIRWSVDLGLQDYTELEEKISVKNLWNSGQNSTRWTLLSKNNFSHSTLTLNNQLHKVDGNAPLNFFTNSKTQPEAEFDLSALFPETLASATRKFKKLSEKKLEIRDSLTLTSKTQTVTWTMMTKANAEITDKGFLLTQNGKKLFVNLVAPLKAEKKITLLDPPPLSYDMRVPNLKKITFTIISETFKTEGAKIVVHIFDE